MLTSLRLLAAFNTIVLRTARQLAWAALAVMVMVILLQVVCRYVLNNALAWPDEAARFLMLWMVGLMAPSAFRWNGFVAIDMLPRALPRVPGLALVLLLLLLSLAVLLTSIGHSYNHTFGFGGRFDSASLKLPLDWIGLESVRVKLKYMYASLFVCIVFLISVNVELILRTALTIFAPDTPLPDDDAPVDMLGAD